jgi:hypothetical protein
MRKATLGLLIVLCLSGATSWQGQPQWRVIQHVVLTEQTAPISQTTVFTPTKRSVYRLSAYFSAGGSPQANWEWFFYWNDLDGTGFQTSLDSSDGPSELGAMIFASQPGVPVTFATIPNPQPHGGYDLLFTIEELE